MVRSGSMVGSWMCLAALLAASPAAAQCSDWQRQVLLPRLGCGPDLIEDICSGQLPIPTQPYCDDRARPEAGMGDWCQTPMGGCTIEQPTSLDSDCECYSPAGWVAGWVTLQ